MGRIGYRQDLLRDPRPVPAGELWIEIPDKSIMEEDYLPGTHYTKLFSFKIGHWTGRRSYASLPYGSMVSQDVLDVINSKGKGTMSGPTTSVDNNVPRFDGTSGQTLQGSPVSIADNGDVTGLGKLNGSQLPPIPGLLLTSGSQLVLLSSGAALSGQVPQADGAGGITWATPSGGGGINQLTGDVLAGPGTGSQAATLASVIVAGSAGAANTVPVLSWDAKGRIMSVTTATITPAAIGAPSGSGTSTGTNTGDQTNITGNAGTATALQTPRLINGVSFDGTANITIPVGSGDVVGPAGATDGSFARWDGITGKLLKDGVLPSTGGNGAADDGLVAIYGTEGQLQGSAQVGGSYAVQGIATIGAVAGKFTAVNGTGLEVSSVGGKGGSITTAADNIGLQVQNNSSTTQPALDVTNLGTADIAHFEGPTGGVMVLTDGGLQWTSGTGAQTTATNLPAFGAGTKGVVPAAPAIVGTTKYLREDGTWSVPPDTDTGITQLTGDGTAGPGSGSQAFTLATVNPNVGTFGSVTKAIIATFNAKGLVTSVSESTITPAIGSVTGLGTGVAAALATNTGSAGAIVLFDGAGGTPSSLVLTNATGLPIAGITGLGTGVAAALAIAVGSAGAFVTFNGAGGTPSSLTLTNATGLPISTGLTGLGTGVAAALAIAIGSAGAVVVNGGALGTPSSGVATNLTGTASGLTAGNVTTNANLTGPVTSVGNATSIAAGVITPAMLSTATQTPTPTTGQTQTFNTSSNNELIACLHSATIAAQTFVIPADASSVVGQELTIFSRAAITTVTLTTNSNTIYGSALTTFAAAGVYLIRKVAASTWVRLR